MLPKIRFHIKGLSYLYVTFCADDKINSIHRILCGQIMVQAQCHPSVAQLYQYPLLPILPMICQINVECCVAVIILQIFFPLSYLINDVKCIVFSTCCNLLTSKVTFISVVISIELFNTQSFLHSKVIVIRSRTDRSCADASTFCAPSYPGFRNYFQSSFCKFVAWISFNILVIPILLRYSFL